MGIEVKISEYPVDFIPDGAQIIISVSTDYIIKGFYDPKTGEYHIQDEAIND